MLQPDSVSVDLAALSAEDALGLLKLLFITKLHLTGSRSEDLARLRANFNIFSAFTDTCSSTGYSQLSQNNTNQLNGEQQSQIKLHC